MASELGISLILQIGKLSQVLSNVGNQKNTLFKGAAIDQRLPVTIYQVWKPLSLRYAANPSDPTVRQVAEYLLALCGPYALRAQQIINNLTGALPVITGPNDASINVGQTATFSVTVVSSTNVTYQWFRGGVAIPGATSASYSLTNAQLSDTGAQFSVVATNSTGPVTSATATLTVTASIEGFFTYSPTVDFYPILVGNSDPFSYGTSYSITHNAPVVIALPNTMPANQYMLAKIPSGESIKTAWNNTALNNGTIPDSTFESVVTFGGFDYYASRGQITMDTTSTLTLS